MASLLNKVRRTGFLILIGLVVIIYIGMSFLYFQQSPSQTKITGQITQLQTVINKPLASAEKLNADYKQATTTLTLLPSQEILQKITDIAKESGIDIEPSAGKFTFPSASTPKALKVGTHNYQVLSFTGIKVQGEYSKVMDFITRLESGDVLPTFVIKSLTLKDVSLPEEVEGTTGETEGETGVVIVTPEEENRIKEYKDVLASLNAMMEENQLSSIPNPAFTYANGKATNDMSIFPDIRSGWEALPLGKTIDPAGNLYLTGDMGRTSGTDISFWNASDLLTAEGTRLIAEGDALIAEGNRLNAEGDKLWEAGYNLWSQGYTLGGEKGEALQREGNDLMLEGHKFMVEGDTRIEEGKALKTQGSNLRTAGGKLREEGNAIWKANNTTWIEGDKTGYVLYQQDNKADGSKGYLVDYLSSQTTEYYYALNANGVLLQFDGPDIETAKQFIRPEVPESQSPNVPISDDGQTPNAPEFQAVLNVDLYSLAPTTSKTK